MIICNDCSFEKSQHLKFYPGSFGILKIRDFFVVNAMGCECKMFMQVRIVFVLTFDKASVKLHLLKPCGMSTPVSVCVQYKEGKINFCCCFASRYTLPKAKILSGKNVWVFLVFGLLMKSFKKDILRLFLS